MLAGHQQEIQAERDRKLEAVRQQRQNRRQRAATDETDHCRFANYPPSESDTDNTCLIESGDQLTGCLPDVRHKAVPHFLAIGPVAFQIACQQLLLAKDAQNEQPDRGQTYEKATNGAEQQRATNEH